MRYLLMGLTLLAGLTFLGPTPAEARLVCHRNYYGELVCRHYRPSYYGYYPRRYANRTCGFSRYSGRYTCDINEIAGCPRFWTVQDGVCKPYRGY